MRPVADPQPPPLPRPADSPPPLPPTTTDEPVFRLSPREGADSILSEPEESEDEVFGSQGLDRLPVPELPDPDPAPVAPGGAAAGGPPTPSPVGSVVPPPMPMSLSAPPPAAVGVAPSSPPATPSAPTWTSSPPADPWAANPWAGFSAPAHETAPSGSVDRPAAPQLDPDGRGVAAPGQPADARHEPAPDGVSATRAARAGRRATAAGGTAASRILIGGLAAWAIIATVAAVYGLVFGRGERLDPGHPLSVIPDTFGEFDPASRKKVSQFRFDIHQPLPPNLKAGLGGRISVDPLVIEPLGVEKRRLVMKAETKGGTVSAGSPGEALVLRLRVTNTSPDLLIHPLDPAFNRKTTDKIPTHLVVGKQVFYGGPVPWPFRGGRVFEQQQEKDAEPLGPGETRDYVVCSDASPRLLGEVRKANEPLLWRVQVRRGLIEFRGREIPVTAVVGIEFRRDDILGL